MDKNELGQVLLLYTLPTYPKSLVIFELRCVLKLTFSYLEHVQVYRRGVRREIHHDDVRQKLGQPMPSGSPERACIGE